MLSAAWRTQSLDLLSAPGDTRSGGNNQVTFVPRFIDFDAPAYSVSHKATGGRRSVHPLDSHLHNEDA